MYVTELPTDEQLTPTSHPKSKKIKHYISIIFDGMYKTTIAKAVMNYS